jgi:hypothetical protein
VGGGGGIQVPPATKWVRQAAALMETRPAMSLSIVSSTTMEPWRAHGVALAVVHGCICRCNDINEIPRATPHHTPADLNLTPPSDLVSSSICNAIARLDGGQQQRLCLPHPHGASENQTLGRPRPSRCSS